MRTIIYIDGFNFYYGAVKNTPYKWLDFKSLFQKLLASHNQIVQIKYFTALVSGKYNSQKPIKQQTFLRALKEYIPEIEIYYGHFLTHEVYVPLAKPENDKRTVKIIKTEEKGSDVNISVHLLNDAWLNNYDCAVVVSNDSDLAESMKLVKVHHPDKTLGLVMPGKGHPSKELMQHADFVKRVRTGVLKSSQLPHQIPKTSIVKPKDW
ncbi:MAG: NYN domain-containing protein [Melioribacteraceae bacterium]|nr:NYN domain-containing protein [Melioribacteraceae bacterium]WKZ69278.1 MAG: NYN domain-containing protein [Melioribacteraceae bacterium]